MDELDPMSLATEVVRVMQGVLIHQRARWGTLLGHQSGFEAWWKAEFAQALESWSWSENLKRVYRGRVEAKPSAAGIGEGRQATDLLVETWRRGGSGMELTPDGPRVWLELKERGTWWGPPAKAFGEANGGLLSDLRKWDDVRWTKNDIVLACQVLSHDAEDESSEALPQKWREFLDQQDRDPRPRFCPRVAVGYPLPGSKAVRWVHLEVFKIAGQSARSRTPEPVESPSRAAVGLRRRGKTQRTH